MNKNEITSMSHKTPYLLLCEEAILNDNTFNNFKTFPQYKDVLEHVTKEQGQLYYDFVSDNYQENIEKLQLCSINDEQGNPTKEKYSFGKWSPSTLRYFKVSLDINHLFGDTSKMNILEIGGGYGGQCMIHSSLFNFKSWTIIDLPEVIKLQEKYLKEIDNVKFISCYDIDAIEDYDLVISNYAFSEVTRKYQDFYIDSFMNKNEKIYMTLNFINHPSTIYYTMYKKDELISKLQLTEFPETPNTNANNIISVRGQNKDITL